MKHQKFDPFTNILSEDIDTFSSEFEFVLQQDVTFELTVEYMMQFYPDNILTEQLFQHFKSDCFAKREYVSIFDFEYNYLREIDFYFSNN